MRHFGADHAHDQCTCKRASGAATASAVDPAPTNTRDCFFCCTDLGIPAIGRCQSSWRSEHRMVPVQLQCLQMLRKSNQWVMTSGVWSLEAVLEKYLNGRAVNKAANLQLGFLSCAQWILRRYMPQQRAVGDNRPAGWLESQKKISAPLFWNHALCSSHTFGMAFVDGGAFTGDDEWSPINSHCSYIPWISHAALPSSKEDWLQDGKLCTKN